jgi:hypothetical protein
MYVVQYEVTVAFVPDGAGPMTEPAMQKIVFRPQFTGPYASSGMVQYGWPVGPGLIGIPVPGLDAPTQGNFRTAISGASSAPTAAVQSLFGDLDTQIAASLGRIQGFATGGG